MKETFEYIMSNTNWFPSMFTESAFPIREWDRLIEQGDITLNLLRSSRRFPNLSAYASIYSIFNFNNTPMTPPDTKQWYMQPLHIVKVLDHTLEAWYVGPALEHYRCFKCYVTITASIRCIVTIEWFPKTIQLPETTTEDYQRQSATDMLQILQTKES